MLLDTVVQVSYLPMMYSVCLTTYGHSCGEDSDDSSLFPVFLAILSSFDSSILVITIGPIYI